MPLFFEPGQKYPIVLDSDADKPVDVQPTFYAVSLAMSGQLRVGVVLDLWTISPNISITELFDETITVLSEVFVGWKNMGGKEYSADAMREILTYTEARELLRKVMFNQHITATEKKS